MSSVIVFVFMLQLPERTCLATGCRLGCPWCVFSRRRIFIGFLVGHVPTDQATTGSTQYCVTIANKVPTDATNCCAL